jgi:hypothetical protein
MDPLSCRYGSHEASESGVGVMANLTERRAHDRSSGASGTSTLWLRASGGERLLAVVVDHGGGGAQIELSGVSLELSRGDIVGLEPKSPDSSIEPWPSRGEIVWIDGVHLGMRFLDDD